MPGVIKLLEKLVGRSTHRRRRVSAYSPKFEALEPRQLLAVTATFSAATGVLNVFGDGNDNTIELVRNASGGILVNNGAVSVVGGTPTVANTALIRAFGLGGNDTITINEALGALPAAHLYGGSGVDTLTGGSGGDLIFGQSGEDIILGRGGFDMLFGGSSDDSLTGGDADDQAFGQSGNDRMIWNPGDDTDLNEGGAGTDSVEVNGGNGDESFTTTANGTRVRFDRLNPAPFSIDIGTSEKLVVNMNGGQDSFSATGNLAALIQITVDGGSGNDTILGSNGNDQLLGGDGDDFFDGQQGNDTAFGGENNDTFQWDPGDGNDTFEGQNGNDKLIFNGSAGNEIFDVSANADRVRVTRNLGAVVMDLDGVEQIDLNALGGVDAATVNNLAGTDVSLLNIFLGLFGGALDGAADNVIVNASNGQDVLFVSGDASGVNVAGLSALLNIFSAESNLDRLTVNLLDGDDVLDASALASTGIALTVNGGNDDDAITGGGGVDTLNGNDGDDVLIGGPGIDLLDGGTGDNVVIQ
jgi:Ca2+-binding RTX toxin-like protein